MKDIQASYKRFDMFFDIEYFVKNEKYWVKGRLTEEINWMDGTKGSFI